MFMGRSCKRVHETKSDWHGKSMSTSTPPPSKHVKRLHRQDAGVLRGVVQSDINWDVLLDIVSMLACQEYVLLLAEKPLERDLKNNGHSLANEECILARIGPEGRKTIH